MLLYKAMKILILGATGMLGHTLLAKLSKNHEVLGTSRKTTNHPQVRSGFVASAQEKHLHAFQDLINEFKPDFVINCIGAIKQYDLPHTHFIEINSLWPHLVAKMCQTTKLIHFSTDCVFTGKKGGYSELDTPDAQDSYGLSKNLGELKDYKNALTLRTSIIGHEQNSQVSLLEWFLSQQKECKGFTGAIFSGFPTTEVAEILDSYIFKSMQAGLHSLYHFSAEPISKYDLLNLIKDTYEKDIEIHKEDSVKIDRSLNSDKLRSEISFSPKPWPQMIEEMYKQRRLT